MLGEEMLGKNKIRSQRICHRVALAIAFYLLILLLLDDVTCQLAWSPIQVDSESEYMLEKSGQ